MKYSYAGLRPRALAFALDYIIIAAYLVAIVGVGLAVNRFLPGVRRSLFSNPASGQITGFLVITLPVTLYFALLESSAWQATWGKRRMGLKVMDANGDRISKARALWRTILKFVPWELSHTLIWQISFAADKTLPIFYLGFGVVWLLVGANVVSLLVSKTRQTLYDKLAGTFVVRERG